MVHVGFIKDPTPSERCDGCVDNIARVRVEIGQEDDGEVTVQLGLCGSCTHGLAIGTGTALAAIAGIDPHDVLAVFGYGPGEVVQ